MATHSSTLAWKIPWTEEPGRLQSVGLLRVRRDWATSLSLSCIGAGNGNPVQCPCLENPRDGGAWWAAVHGVAKSPTWLSDFPFTFMHWSRKWQPTPVFLPGESQGQGSLVVGHDWNDLAAAEQCCRRQRIKRRFRNIYYFRLIDDLCYRHFKNKYLLCSGQ